MSRREAEDDGDAMVEVEDDEVPNEDDVFQIADLVGDQDDGTAPFLYKI